MNRKPSAFVLTLAALLCFLPAAAALDASSLPEDTAASMVQSAGTEDAAAAEDLPEPQEERPVLPDNPILPENPPTMISYTTPEEIGFPVDEAEAASDVPEDAQEPAAPSEEIVSSAADATVSPSAEQPAPAPVVSTLPQTGTSAWLVHVLLAAGFLLTAGGWFFTRKQSNCKH